MSVFRNIKFIFIVLAFISLFVACTKKKTGPTEPSPPVYEVIGDIYYTFGGDEETTTKVTIKRDVNTNDYVYSADYYDEDNKSTGKAKMVVKKEVMDSIEEQPVMAPGSSIISIYGLFEIQVTIIENPSNSSQYLVSVTRVDTQEFITFFVNKDTIGKMIANGSSLQGLHKLNQANQEPSFLSITIGGTISFLCMGSETLYELALQCNDVANSVCTGRGVKLQMLNVTMDNSGCIANCTYECNPPHNQGGTL